MNVLEAAEQFVSFLESQDISYALIGGIAVQQWGEPRATRDVDVMVMVPEEQFEAFVMGAVEQFRARIPEPIDFAMQTRVLLLETDDGVPVDVSFGVPGYEAEVMRRKISVAFPSGRSMEVIGPEDLIIHKCLAGRARDLEDVERILIRQGQRLDLEYVREWLREFTSLVEEHDVEGFLEAAMKKVRRT